MPGARKKAAAPAASSPKKESREAELSKRAASRGYAIEKRDGKWWAVVGGTSYGPMSSLDALDEFLPKE